MNIYFGLNSLPEPPRRAAVAVGVFDGVHRGHQEILLQTTREARSQGYLPVAMTFDIHPSELFAPDHAPPYIASLEQRIAWMETLGGIDTVVVVQFDRAFADLSPQAFVADVLEQKLGARHVLVGSDFCYGKGRVGNITSLVTAGARDGFAVTVVPPFLIHEERVSSTQIRGLIGEGHLPQAVDLLGHPFVVQGTVVQGKKLGRTLGFPTANLQPIQPRQLLPGNGIYAGWAILPDGERRRAAVSVGTNPTTDLPGTERKVEAYLMDGFSSDLYGQVLSLDFVQKIRDEWRFETLEALIAQIHKDVTDISQRLRAETAAEKRT